TTAKAGEDHDSGIEGAPDRAGPARRRHGLRLVLRMAAVGRGPSWGAADLLPDQGLLPLAFGRRFRPCLADRRRAGRGADRGTAADPAAAPARLAAVRRVPRPRRPGL